MRSVAVRRIAVAVAGLGVALAAAFPSNAGAMGQVHCAGAQASTSGTGQGRSVGNLRIDPIGERGVAKSRHMHQFFGSTAVMTMATPEVASYANLIGTPTSCDLPADSALYWIPLLTRAGVPVPLKRMEAYYLGPNGELTDPSMTTQAFPDDLRLVAGNAMATSRRSMDLKHVYWDCGAFSTKSAYDGHWATPAAANCATARPLPGGKVVLTLAVTFPSCWDGRLNDHTTTGDTADFNGNPMAATVQHLAYPTALGCPAAFPIKLVTLRQNVSWDYRGNGKNVWLSSGPGYTAHADFLNSWTDPGLSDIVRYCVNTTMTEEEMHALYPEICGPPIPCPTRCTPARPSTADWLTRLK
ncbi:MAG: hypothetical protein QOF73_1802 [Thermomicrobiales bacterium]|jgi:hypothetical protein|nr:hypothetical protein [Thermomicrobiales bacterium]